jgi:hypothetical protein
MVNGAARRKGQKYSFGIKQTDGLLRKLKWQTEQHRFLFYEVNNNQ